jgi:hypothetical protein
MSDLGAQAYNAVLTILYPNGDIGAPGEFLGTQLERLRIDAEAIQNGDREESTLIGAQDDLTDVIASLARMAQAAGALVRILIKMREEEKL